MALQEYIRQGKELLRCGYTTGSCATLGAKACGIMLLSREVQRKSKIITPKGIPVEVTLEQVCLEGDKASCAVKKDGGDDFDVTHGALIVVTVTLLKEGDILITGGEGVGKVTKKGLDQPVGASAINSVPRQMIVKELEELQQSYQYKGGFHVEISIPNGAVLAEKTFNPYMGIVGGLSILGTTGIVEPKSTTALLSSIEAELKMHQRNGVTDLILTPGQYGSAFLRDYPTLSKVATVQISNFLGDCLDLVAVYGFKRVLLVGHVGKLVKVSAGIMNTHSRYADGRVEIFSAYTALCGGNQPLIQALMDSVSTDACLDLLEEAELLQPVLEKILKSSEKHLKRRAEGYFQIGMLLFSNVRGELGISEEANLILNAWKQKEN